MSTALLGLTMAVAGLITVGHLFAQRELVATHHELDLAHDELAALAGTDPVTLAGAFEARGDPRTPADTDALTGAVEALALLVDERDSYTDSHAAGVAELSRRLATELRCDSADTSTIGVAARLHDIGKVAVPDAILMKPARLTREEWALMRKHPVVGADVLSRIPALRPIAPLVHAHHERWDGTGYPDGVAGDDIPLGARIISVADAFNAMITDRPYSVAIDADAALDEIERCSGTQFDPQVATAIGRTLGHGSAHAPARRADLVLTGRLS